MRSPARWRHSIEAISWSTWWTCPSSVRSLRLEFCFLADWFFRVRGLRDDVDITYVTPLDGAFTKPVASKRLAGMLAEKDINLAAGDVSLRVHELIVLPLPAGQRIGHREVKSDGRVDETGSLGEAAKPCGAGAGDGIDPGGLSWTTLQLRPGTYEMFCNIPGHYAAGMYRTLVVS